MAAIPGIAELTGPSVTEDQLKQKLSQLFDYLTGLLASTGDPAAARVQMGTMRDLGAGARVTFQQTAAPIGWTKEAGAAYNDAALRVVTGAASTGGADNFTTHFGTGKSSNGYALLLADIPAHNHTVTDSGHTHDYTAPNGGAAFFNLSAGPGPANSAGINNTSTSNGSGISVNNNGGGGSHSHVLANFNIKYVDHIIAQKDAAG